MEILKDHMKQLSELVVQEFTEQAKDSVFAAEIGSLIYRQLIKLMAFTLQPALDQIIATEEAKGWTDGKLDKEKFIKALYDREGPPPEGAPKDADERAVRGYAEILYTLKAFRDVRPVLLEALQKSGAEEFTMP